MIDILNLVADDKIEDGQKLIVIDEKGKRYKYTYMLLNGGTFVNNSYTSPKLAKRYPNSKNFLNLEAELIYET